MRVLVLAPLPPPSSGTSPTHSLTLDTAGPLFPCAAQPPGFFSARAPPQYSTFRFRTDRTSACWSAARLLPPGPLLAGCSLPALEVSSRPLWGWNLAQTARYFFWWWFLWTFRSISSEISTHLSAIISAAATHAFRWVRYSSLWCSLWWSGNPPVGPRITPVVSSGSEFRSSSALRCVRPIPVNRAVLKSVDSG